MIPKQFRGEITGGEQRFYDIEVSKVEISATPNSSNRKLYFNYSGKDYIYHWYATPQQGLATLSVKDRKLDANYSVVIDGYQKTGSLLENTMYEVARQYMISIRL